LNQLWAEETEKEEDAEVVVGDLKTIVVPSIGESMAVRLLRAKGRSWSAEVEDKGRHLLTLVREGSEEAWGFSLVGGREALEHGGFWSGVATRRGEQGLWLSVGSVREESPAGSSGLRSKDLVTRINGRIVFHLDPADVARLIRQSGKSLYLDIERLPSKDLLYSNGLHQYSYNFLYPEAGSETLGSTELGRKLRTIPATAKITEMKTRTIPPLVKISELKTKRPNSAVNISELLVDKPGRHLLTGVGRRPFKELASYAGDHGKFLRRGAAPQVGGDLSSVWSRGE